MSQEIATPFQLTPSGTVAVTTSPAVQAQQHVQALVSTQPGERVMQPGYGVSLNALVFGSDDPAIVTVIQQDVTAALNTWEPSLIIQGVSPVPGNDPSQGEAAVNVNYSLGTQIGADSAVHTATVIPGGQVISDA